MLTVVIPQMRELLPNLIIADPLAVPTLSVGQ